MLIVAIIERIKLLKGAPETIQERLVDLPSNYVDTYKKYTRQGSRVLALAYKNLPEMTVSEARNMERDQVESGLVFAGFAVFNCPIRPDSGSVLKELKEASHDLVMITGDQALTACHVASQVNIISRPALILTPKKNGSVVEWVSPDETEVTAFRYIMVMKINDPTAEAWITAFNEPIEEIIDCSADDLYKIKNDEGEDIYEQKLKELLWIPRLFRVGVTQI